MDIFTLIVNMLVVFLSAIFAIYSMASAILFPKFLLDLVNNLYNVVSEIIRQKRHKETIRKSTWIQWQLEYLKRNLTFSILFIPGFIVFVFSIMLVLNGELVLKW